MRILVAEDEEVSRAKLTRILADLGECQVAADGTQALAAFIEAWESLQPFDLICLDINMPSMDGQAVLSEIRRIETTMDLAQAAKAKIIMVTGQSDLATVAMAMNQGCDDFIVKPFEPSLVKEKVSGLFRAWP